MKFLIIMLALFYQVSISSSSSLLLPSLHMNKPDNIMMINKNNNNNNIMQIENKEFELDSCIYSCSECFIHELNLESNMQEEVNCLSLFFIIFYVILKIN